MSEPLVMNLLKHENIKDKLADWSKKLVTG